MHGDICVYDYTPKEHDWHLLQFMKTAKHHGIIFNSSKAWIRQSQTTFYGAVFAAQGMWPDPSKIQALNDLPTPESPVRLQSFLGLKTTFSPLSQLYLIKLQFFESRSPSGTGTPWQMQSSSASGPGSARPSSTLPLLTMTDPSQP